MFVASTPWSQTSSHAGRRSSIMASKKAKDLRPIIKLKSTAGTGFTYVTRKNRRNTPDRLVLRKFDPVVRRHVEYKESR